MRQHEVLQNIQNMRLREPLCQRLDILNRRVAIVYRKGILNRVHKQLLQRIRRGIDHTHNLFIGLHTESAEQNKKRKGTAHHGDRHTDLPTRHLVERHAPRLLRLWIERHHRCISRPSHLGIRLAVHIEGVEGLLFARDQQLLRTANNEVATVIIAAFSHLF